MTLVLDVLYSVLVLVMVVQGLAIIFGMLRVINLAHGECMMLGAYSLWLLQRVGIPFVPSLLVTAVFMALIGALIYWLIIQRIRLRLIDTILATWGLAIVIQQTIRLLFGPASQHVDSPTSVILSLFGVDYPLYRVIIMLVSLCSLLGLYWLFFFTRFGVQARAVMNNPELAQSAGIAANRIYAISFIIGIVITGLAGALIAPTMSISPLMGGDYLVPAFLSVLIGGLGSIMAALGGASLIAGSQSVLSFLFDSVTAQLGMLILAIMVLKFFPKGIFRRTK